MVRIVSLVENSSECGCKTAHGLSLYIETASHRVLFDVGGDDTFIRNSEQLGVDLRSVDVVIISHGHRDHGGALSLFLELNDRARVYVQRGAFKPHFSHRATGVSDIGLDVELMNSERVVLLDGDFEIDDELHLFKVSDSSECRSSANSSLYEGDEMDRFDHEQNLIIRGEKPILIMGCGHNGIVNIMKQAKRYAPSLCVGGYHLTSPSAHRDEPRTLIDQIIERLGEYPDVEFFTCHCTGVEVFRYMSSKMENMHYLSCGETIVV